MARNFAPIYTAIWNDKAFRALAAGAQRMYLLLVSQPDINAAGVLPLTVRRWAEMASDTDPKAVGKALRELVDTGFVVADQRTEELLVRSFVRWDKAYPNPRRRPAILAAAKVVGSVLLRRALVVEFTRVGLPVDGFDPGPDGADCLSDSHSDRQSHSQTAASPNEKASPQVNRQTDSHSDRQSDCLPDSHRFLVPVVGTREVVGTTGPLAPKHPRSNDRGHHLPDDFAVTDDMRDWVGRECPGLDWEFHTKQFIDYWAEIPGAKGRKISWTRTWQRWMRTEHKREQSRRPSNVVALRGGVESTRDRKVANTLALAAEFDAIGEPS